MDEQVFEAEDLYDFFFRKTLTYLKFIYSWGIFLFHLNNGILLLTDKSLVCHPKLKTRVNKLDT